MSRDRPNQTTRDQTLCAKLSVSYTHTDVVTYILIYRYTHEKDRD